MQIPKTVRDLRQRLTQSGIEFATSDSRGAFAGLLASSRGSGIYLCSGDDSLDSVGWIIDALDMSGRLIVHRTTADRLEILRECYNTDLRISVHAQDLAEFLDDVQRHQFEIIVLSQSMCTQANIQRTATALSDGGFLILYQSTLQAEIAQYEGMQAFVFSELADIGTLVVRRRNDSHPRRRGGRRGRSA